MLRRKIDVLPKCEIFTNNAEKDAGDDLVLVEGDTTLGGGGKCPSNFDV